MNTSISLRIQRFAFILILLAWSLPAAAQTPEVADPSAPVTTLASAAAEEGHRLAAQTVRVERRRNDSVLNGALIGAAAGVASGLFVCRMMEPWEVCNDPGPLVRVGAVGAAIGIGVDALIRKREVVDLPAGSAQVYVAPVAGRGAKGLQVAVRF